MSNLPGGLNKHTLFALAQLLVGVARRRETISYGEVSKRLGAHVSPNFLAQPLGYLSEVAVQNEVPAISVLVVQAGTGLPGPGFYAFVGELMGEDVRPADWEQFFHRVCREAWACSDWDSYLDALADELSVPRSPLSQKASAKVQPEVPPGIPLKTIEADLSAELEEEGRTEGKVSVYYGKRYERDAANRKKAIDLHGKVCAVCGFDFEHFYGDRGKDFIEVHHRKPLSHSSGSQQVVNPATDLVPLCANCHRMIHRHPHQLLTVEELKETVARRRHPR